MVLIRTAILKKPFPWLPLTHLQDKQYLQIRCIDLRLCANCGMVSLHVYTIITMMTLYKCM